ncbi:MAG: sugar ABC transporter ATP-binding protein [Acidobacteriota bacterium]
MAEALAPAPRFDMRGVTRSFGSTRALSGVDLAVRAGDVCALVGQNGAGKSTLMGILAGALRPDSGVMRLDDAPYAPANPLAARRAGIAMIYQHLSLAPHLSVMENIALGLEPTRWGIVRRAEVRRAAEDALARLGHEALRPDALVSELSPAEQQLVEIARALASGCRVLVLDEPTSSLTRADVTRLFGLIARLKDQGHAIVYISHFLEEVKDVSDRVVVLRDGRNVGQGATSDMSIRDIAALMVGGDVEDLYPRTARQTGEALLDVRDLSSGAASFTLHRGEVLGIAGLLGAGRTRLLRTIFGLERVRDGQIRLGVHQGAFAPADRWAQGMGLVSEDRASEGLAAALSIADNLTLSHLDDLGPPGLVSPSRQDAATRTWIERLAIRCAGPRQPVAELSGGNQQKVAVARLLHHDVDVLLLDEPTRGIDVASKAQIYALIDALVAPKTGPPKAVLLVSSYFPELLGVCDRIAVMSRGRLGAPRAVGAWTEHALIMAASGAMAS